MAIATSNEPINAAALNKYLRGGANNQANLAVFSATVTNSGTSYTLTNKVGTAFDTSVSRSGAGQISISFATGGYWSTPYIAIVSVKGSELLATVTDNHTQSGFDIYILDKDEAAFDDTNNNVQLEILVIAYV